MSYGSDYANAATDILLAKGDALARAKAQNAAGWGQTIATLGQAIPQHVQETMRRAAEQRKAVQIQQIFQQAGGDLEKAIPALMQIDPELGTKFAKEHGEALKNAYELRKLDWDYKQARLTRADQLLARVNDEESYGQWAYAMKQAGEDISGIPPQFDPAWVKGKQRALLSEKERLELDKPKEPKYFPMTPGMELGKVDEAGNASVVLQNPYQLTPDQIADNERMAEAERRAQAAQQETARHNRAMEAQAARGGADGEPLVQVMENGVPVWRPRSQAAGQPAAQAPRSVTGQERQVIAFYNRAKEAVETITTASDSRPSLEDRVAKSGLATQIGLQYAPNVLKTSDQQAYRQAQRAFTEARLRKESGAAIPNAEYENDAKTYFAQPGDKPELIEQKRKARQTVLDGLKFAAGRAYEEFYGMPNDAGVGAQPQTPPVKAAPKVGDTVTFQGKRYKVKAIRNGTADLEPIQ